MNKKILYVVLAVVVLLLFFLLYISIANCDSLNTITKNFLGYFNLIVTPICLIAGIIIGYPLIRRKLVEDYVSRQFEIMHEANRNLRKECLNVMNKYPQNGNSNQLKKEEIKDCVLDIANLSHLAFDANPDAHRYSKLLENTLNDFYKLYPDLGNHHYYKEAFYCFVNVHVKQIYDYAKTLGTTFDSNLNQKRRLTKKLDKFVHDNKYTDIESLDYSINYYHTSQLLVIYFGNSNSNTAYDNPMLYYANYKVAPTPCPFARLLYVSEIYLPLVFKSKKPQIFGFEKKLNLIGFSSRKSINNNGEERHYYVCYYANIEDFGFVKGTIKGISSMTEFQDDYLKIGEFCDYTISDFEVIVGTEIIKLEVEADLLHKMFVKNKKLLTRKMKNEVRGKI